MDTRYARQIGLIGEKGQAKLSKAWVLIVGAGGLGNICAKFLASSGVGNILIIDHDTVELCNLNRQIMFNKESIGKGKAESLCKTLEKINPEINCYAFEQRFEKPFGIQFVDLVLDCTDNMESSYFIEQEALKEGIPDVFAKTSKYCGVVTILGNKPYLENNYPMKQLNKDNSVFPPIGGIVGSYQANLALKLLLGLKVTDKVIHFDCLNDSIIQYEKGGK